MREIKPFLKEILEMGLREKDVDCPLDLLDGIESPSHAIIVIGPNFQRQSCRVPSVGAARKQRLTASATHLELIGSEQGHRQAPFDGIDRTGLLEQNRQLVVNVNRCRRVWNRRSVTRRATVKDPHLNDSARGHGVLGNNSSLMRMPRRT